MSQELFDEAAQYDEMLHRGLRLSGEDKTYFIEARLARLSGLVSSADRPRRILDFGCGNGDTSRRLLDHFPGAEVVGIDVSAGALDHARTHHAASGLSFLEVDALEEPGTFDLCYSNGAFHHIRPAERGAVIERLRELLRPGGMLAVFENNPWNPGTRLIMSRVEFDRDAECINGVRMRRLLVQHGFRVEHAVRYLFVFPAALKALRFTEPRLERLPLGGQYVVLANRPERAEGTKPG